MSGLTFRPLIVGSFFKRWWKCYENKYPEGFAEQVYIWLRNKAITSGFCLLLESNVMGREMFSAITLKVTLLIFLKKDKNYRVGLMIF